MVEIQKRIEPQSKTNNYHIRKQPIIENPHNQPFKQGSYEDVYSFQISC